MTITTDINSSGLQPTPPTTLQSQLIQLVAASNPGYTANLPGSLIEDISSTDVGALALIDQARVDLFNSITPYSANSFLLNQLGQIYGVQQGINANTSVYVTFSGSPGFVISIGFTVSDGSHQYTVQDGGIVGSTGQSVALYCLANTQGSWAVPSGTVTQIITSLPSGVTLTCTNLTDGLPGEFAQSLEDYQAQVIQAGLATAQGMPNFLKTQLENVIGVQARLISVRNLGANQWQIIVGGGDPYQVANAIYTGLFDISTLTGSILEVVDISSTDPAEVTTNLNHGYSDGQIVTIADVDPLGFNGSFTITVLSEKTFSIPLNGTGLTYINGGVVTPNLRNVSVTINNYPDSYNIIFVNPPVQVVNISLVWNTSSLNYVSPTAVAQLGQPAIVNYINSIPVGQTINIFELQNVFQIAISGIIPIPLLSRMIFTVEINGIITDPDVGTGLIYGDPESYFETSNQLVVITQG